MEHISNEDRLFFSLMKEPEIQKILIVCHGNTCRSIIAEAILLKNKPKYEIYSVGTKAKGEEISKNTKKVLFENNLYSTKKYAEHIDKIKNIRFNRVLILDDDIEINQNIKRNFTHKRMVQDPYGKELEVYRKVFQEIKEILENIPNMSWKF